MTKVGDIRAAIKDLADDAEFQLNGVDMPESVEYAIQLLGMRAVEGVLLIDVTLVSFDDIQEDEEATDLGGEA